MQIWGKAGRQTRQWPRPRLARPLYLVNLLQLLAVCEEMLVLELQRRGDLVGGGRGIGKHRQHHAALVSLVLRQKAHDDQSVNQRVHAGGFDVDLARGGGDACKGGQVGIVESKATAKNPWRLINE